MKGFWQAILNFLLYSHLFIALCAVAMTAQTFYLLGATWSESMPLLGLVATATLVIYALHRLISLSKIKEDLHTQRYKVIRHYARHIKLYALISVVLGAVCFFYLAWMTQILLCLPALLSLGYVLPFLGNQKRRLRDINFIKIFLIAGVWSYVTILLPLAELGQLADEQTWAYLLERALFIFIITLPFDIRDWEIDKEAGVLTIPATVGVRATFALAALLTIAWLVLGYWLYVLPIFYGFVLSGISTFIFVLLAHPKRHDYYFTAVLDGTMLLQFGLVLGMDCLF